MTRVLWIDDDAAGSLRAVGHMLQRRGLRVDVAVDCETAIHLFEKSNYDAVLLDLILPGSEYGEALSPYSGLRLAERMKKLAAEKTKGQQPEFVALSVVADEKVVVALDQLGIRYFGKLELLEPGSIDALVAALKGEETRDDA